MSDAPDDICPITKCISIMKTPNMLLLGLALPVLVLSSCLPDEDPDECVDFDTTWGYEGEHAPESWDICLADCGGGSQSPIDITGAVPDPDLAPLDFTYHDEPIKLVNKGHTAEFEYEAGSGNVLVFEGEEYELEQFHFHTSSEHTVAGQQYEMEVHLVHKNADKTKAVVMGVLIAQGSENPFLANFIDHIPPTKSSTPYEPGTEVNVADFLPADPGYYTYGGSLTTPPCSEVVTWLLRKAPVEASAEQIERVHELFEFNNRPVQAVNGREIREF